MVRIWHLIAAHYWSRRLRRALMGAGLPLLLAAAEAPAPIPISAEDRSEFQLLQLQQERINAEQQAIRARLEALRLRSCLAAKASAEECGQVTLTQQGPVVARIAPARQAP